MTDLYPWQAKDWQHLTAYVAQQRIPQALFISGAEGLGKQVLALQFAQYVMCKQPLADKACQQCDSCHLFQAGTHPDFLTLQPEAEGKAIGIDSVRAIINKLNLKPQYSGYRVVFVSPANQLNINSANAFLKCLEEPPERTVFILVAETLAGLPATIISRCQRLSIAIPDAYTSQQWLEKQGVDANSTALLLSLAHGAPLQALHYQQHNSLVLREQCFKQWQLVLSKQACPIEVADQWFKHPLNELLYWLIAWTEDMIKCHFKLEKKINQDVAMALEQLASQIKLASLFDFHRLLLNNLEALASQVNKQLLCEEILITAFRLGK